MTPWHLRMLTDDPWVGGMGVPMSEIERMTLDQAFMLTTDRKMLRNRVKHMDPLEVASQGGRMKGKIKGKSKARELMEQAAARREAERKVKKRRR